MYIVLLFLLLAVSAFLIFRGIKAKKKSPAIVGGLLAVLTILFFSILDFWGEILWFQQIGYADRIWTEIASKSGFALAAGLIGWIVLTLFTRPLPRENRLLRIFSKAVGFLAGALWGFSNWLIILKFLNRVSSGVSDPVLGQDTGFYMFSLPFLDNLYKFILLLFFLSLVTLLGALFVRLNENTMHLQVREFSIDVKRRIVNWVYVNAAAILFLLAAGKFLNRYELLYSTWGVVTGPGWTDVNIRLPGYLVSIILTVALGITLLLPGLRQRVRRVVTRRQSTGYESVSTLAAVGGLAVLIWFIVLTAAPGLLQWLRVEPNEITFEKPYIKNNIEYTRKAFDLEKVEEREFPAEEIFTESMVENNTGLFGNIRLWDYRALDAVYKQFQEIRLYYEFVDVDVDRYRFQDQYKQVMVSARELEIDNLPLQSQTFVNRRFKYTHGNGMTLTTVSDFTPEGLPNLLIRDIPPKSAYPELEVKQPRIYYGELSSSHVIANSTEPEFDFPSGETNTYTSYSGTGGIPFKNTWRKFLFGWKFDGTRLFLSSYPKADSRMMFHRDIRDRVNTVAPFLKYDNDPYIVLAENGKLYWIMDAYTTSDHYPYSEKFSNTEYLTSDAGRNTRMMPAPLDDQFRGVNYIRNSVKVVVDAYNGSVDFFVFEEKDPVLQVWRNIFPDLFKSRDEMPSNLDEHIRYPADMLLIQGLVYAKYHMTDPTVFYNQEDLWVRATEKYYNRVQPVEPYYIMWEPPRSDRTEYSLILPFTPKNRQVMIGWVAGLCDGENYGRFLSYKFPKEKRVLGPQQVETKIDQDSYLSGQLSLWDQRGSNVIRGNVLAIPVDETLIYVEPIYLKAETAAYPELRLVAVMHNDNLSYAETFDKALRGLFQNVTADIREAGAAETVSFDELIRQANQQFNDYLHLNSEKEFRQAADALQSLQNTLQQMQERAGAGETR